MYITLDLQRRLTPEFATNLLSQLSSSKPAFAVSCDCRSNQPAAILGAPFEANTDGHSRLRMAVLQT